MELPGSGRHLLVIAHHTDNLTNGVGGPQDPDVLYSDRGAGSERSQDGLQVHRVRQRGCDLQQPESTPRGGRVPFRAQITGN